MHIHLHGPIHVHCSCEGHAELKETILAAIAETKGTIMATLDDLKAADVQEDAKIDALIAAYQQQKQAITDLTAQVAANAQDPAKIQELVDAANAKAAAIDAALGAVVQPPSGGGEPT